MKLKNSITAFLIMFLALPAFSADWTRIVDLEGLWHFTVGDNDKWASPDYSTESWDRIYVPDAWEDYYEGYNGYGWYRKTFDVRWVPDESGLALMLGRIDDVDEVYINGVKIGQTGAFMPHFNTAYNTNRLYYLPEGILQKENNVIAVRVYDMAGPGGIVGGNNFGIYFDNDASLLTLDLSGQWKFSTYRDRGVYDTGYDDSKWDEITVPGNWENYGYANYDGYAWYRKTFTIPANVDTDGLYLVLGRIDDFDKVYLNGDLIARTEYLDEYSRYSKGRAWRLYRVYRIPAGQLKRKNVLVVEVRDDRLGGGIYEGPIGLMHHNNARIIEERNEEEVWNNPVRAILRFFDF